MVNPLVAIPLFTAILVALSLPFISVPGFSETLFDINGSFLDLNDTPASYTGQSLNLVRVNSGETGLEFVTPSIATGDTNCSSSVDCNNLYVQKNPLSSQTITNLNGTQLIIQQDGNVSNSTSAGGAILLDNTDNNGAGLIIYSNISTPANGRLLNIRADNTGFDQAAVHIDYDGTANALEVVHNGSDSTAQAFNVVSNNTLDSAFTVTGTEASKGTMKLVHIGNGADGSASAASLQLSGEGTAAQGLFIDSNAASGTQGDLATLRNRGIEYFSVDKNGGTRITTDLTNAFLVETNSTADLFRVDTVNTEIQTGAIFPNGNKAQDFGKANNKWATGWFGKINVDDLNASCSDLNDVGCLSQTDANNLYIQKNPGVNQTILGNFLLKINGTLSTGDGNILIGDSGYPPQISFPNADLASPPTIVNYNPELDFDNQYSPFSSTLLQINYATIRSPTDIITDLGQKDLRFKTIFVKDVNAEGGQVRTIDINTSNDVNVGRNIKIDYNGFSYGKFTFQNLQDKNAIQVTNKQDKIVFVIDENGNVQIDGNVFAQDENTYIGRPTGVGANDILYYGHSITTNPGSGGGNLNIPGQTYAYIVVNSCSGGFCSGEYFSAGAPRGFRKDIGGIGTMHFQGAGAPATNGVTWSQQRDVEPSAGGELDGWWSFFDNGLSDYNQQIYINRNGLQWQPLLSKIYLGTPDGTNDGNTLGDWNNSNLTFKFSGKDANITNETMDGNISLNVKNAAGDINRGITIFDGGRIAAPNIKRMNAAGKLPLAWDLNFEIVVDTSSANSKISIEDLNLYIDTNRISLLKPRTWIDAVWGGRGYGFVAEEVELVFPELVVRDSGGVVVGLDYQTLSIYYAAQLQKEKERADKLEAKVDLFLDTYCLSHPLEPACIAINAGGVS